MRILATIVGLAIALCPDPATGETPANWSAGKTLCIQHDELLKPGPLNVGVHLGTTPDNAKAFARALDFWASVLDMEWRIDDSPNCAIHVFSGTHRLFRSAEVARAHVPDRPAFRGLIAINPQAELTAHERYLLAVHELGHIFGLRHNASARSVMYFLCLQGPIHLDASDLAALAARHKLRNPSARLTTD